MKKIIFLIFLFLIPFCVRAKKIDLELTENIGTPWTDNSPVILSTSDKGFLISYYNYGGDNYYDSILIKYNNKFEKQWEKLFEGDGVDVVNSMIEDENGDYIIIGHTSSSNIDGLVLEGETDGIIAKYDKNGNRLWIKGFGGNKSDTFNDVISTDDGYVIVGTVRSTDIPNLTLRGEPDSIIIKYDKDGNLKWFNSFGGSSSDAFYSVKKIGEYYYAVGYVNSKDIPDVNLENNNEGIIVKYTDDGSVYSVSNNKCYSHIRNIEIIDNEHYLLSGSFNDGCDNYTGAFIGKYTTDDKLVWHTSIIDLDVNIKDVILNKNNNLVLVGYFSDAPYSLNYNGIISEYDHNGKNLGYSIYDINKSDYFTGVINYDNKYLVAGYSSYTSGGKDVVLFKYKNTYEFNINETLNGTVTVVQNDEQGIITLVADNGYELGKIVVKDTLGKDINVVKQEDGTYIFDLYDDVSVDVNFKRVFNVEKKEILNGEVEIVKNDNNLIIKPIPNNGFEYDKIMVKNSKNEVVEVTKLEDGTYSFDLNDDVSVEVLFKKIIENPKTGVIDFVTIIFVGFIVSFVGYLLVRKNCYRYDI